MTITDRVEAALNDLVDGACGCAGSPYTDENIALLSDLDKIVALIDALAEGADLRAHKDARDRINKLRNNVG